MVDYKTEVEILKRDIVKLKADKDFVWSLWKRLQLSSPDLTEAVGLITQREKEKIELKEIELKEEMKRKDDRLRELEGIIEKRNNEIESLKKQNKTVIDRASLLEKQCSDVTDKAERLNELLSSRGDEIEQRELVAAYERERSELTSCVSRLQSQIANLSERNSSLQTSAEVAETELRLARETIEAERQLGKRLRAQIDFEREKSQGVESETEDDREGLESYRGNLDRGRRAKSHGRVIDSEETAKGDTNRTGMYTERHGKEEIARNTAEWDGSYQGDLGPHESHRGDSEARDLHKQIERLTGHVSLLVDCVDATKQRHSVRAKSTPPVSRGKFVDNSGKQRSRRLQLLETRLYKAENLLNEERRISAAASEYLEKANKRARVCQTSLKQVRTELKDTRVVRDQLQANVRQLEMELTKLSEERVKMESEMDKLRANSINDAVRIQQLLTTLEGTRQELVEKKISIDQQQLQESNSQEINRLKDLVSRLERETQRRVVNCPCHNNVSEQTFCDATKDGTEKCDGIARKCRLKIINKRSINSYRLPRNKKTKSLSTIASQSENSDTNTFNTVDNSKEDEWEDIETEHDEEEFQSEPSHSDRSGTGRHSSNSVGTRIAKAAAINQCCDKGIPLRHRAKQAKRNHISRIQEANERSLASENESNIAKNRIASLQQQLKSVMESQNSYRNKLKSTESHLSTLHSDLQQAKLRCNRLVDALKKQSSRYQIILEERKQHLGSISPCFTIEHLLKETGLDNDDFGSDILQSCLGNDNFLNRELQQELSKRNSDILQMRERISKMEREIVCKKRIIDDLRGKVQSLEETKNHERDFNNSREKKVKDLENCNMKLKTQLDSLQTRFGVVLEERRRFEQESADLLTKLDSAESKLNELKQAKHFLESRLNQSDENHEKKITDIVSRSGSAFDHAFSQIEMLKTRCSKYETLIMSLAKDFYQKIKEIRRLVEFGNKRIIKNNQESETKSKSAELLNGYEFARNKAADILSLSTAEIDDLLNGVTEPISKRKEKYQTNNSSVDDFSEFRNKCRQAFKNKCFDQIIQSLFVEKFEELVDLVAPVSYDSGCVSSS